jgi:hypothetical protein
MYQLHEIKISGYRSFADLADLKLRPLTLIYGKNNAGKSALLRLLPILADSVSERAESPLDLSGPAGRGASYLDILWRGQLPDSKRMNLELHWLHEGKRIADIYVLDHSDNVGVYVRNYKSVFDDAAPHFQAEAMAFGEEGKYKISQLSKPETEAPISFTGLVPNNNHQLDALIELQIRLKSLRHKVQWLESVRVAPDRIVRKTGGFPRALQPNGRKAADFLLASPHILHEVQSWYAGPEIRRKLEVSEVLGSMRRVLLNPMEGPCRDIDIVDTGEGMVQVLSVLVAAALAREIGSSAFLAIEEPESHLHANAQKALAAHLAAIATGKSPPTIIAETHSRMLLLGVQLAIARGDLSPDRVCAYWVDQEEDGRSIASLVEFSEKGELRNWPPSVFSEDKALARELLTFQLGVEG